MDNEEVMDRGNFKKMCKTIGQHYFWKGMKEAVRKLVSTCDTCQRTKLAKNKYAKVPPKRNPELIPWNTLCIDLVQYPRK